MGKKAEMLCDAPKGYHWAMYGKGGNWVKAHTKFHSKGWCGHAGAYTQYADINGDGKVDMTCDDTLGRHWTAYSKGNGTFYSNTTQHYTSGADMLAHGPHGLTSTVMERKISPVTIDLADIGQDSPEDTHGAHPSITVPTGARVESPDTPTSGMIPFIQRPKI